MNENKSYTAALSTSDYIPFEERTGDLLFSLQNDYLFKVVFQCEDNDYEILKALLSSLLDIPEAEISHIEILNSIIPGVAVDEKTIMLDIRLTLNGRDTINLEMQVVKEDFWKNRTCFYLSRMYVEELKAGVPYAKLKPAHQISIIDFDVDGVEPRLFSNYCMASVEDGEIYSRNLQISVLNLKRTELATDSDRNRKLDVWAKVFKAKTWEELKHMAENMAVVSKVADKVYAMTGNKDIIDQCTLRLMREAEELSKREQMRELEERYQAKQVEFEAKEMELDEVKVKLDETTVKLDETTVKLDEATVKLDETTVKLDETKLQLKKALEEIERLKASK